ncbi:unnamed protein product [Hyaloperonospora brassicae]|uniref:BEACH domain-containing protein n=1 Tax=Hyaloperonospora brassicae TaxID=162125 RepID=A0AAV0UQA2_HYABA|nr:unnamed protein product [Hyaloperonospora brassicae]
MLACFVDESACSLREREQLIRDVQKLTRLFATKWLLPPDEESSIQKEEEGPEHRDSQSQYVLPCKAVVPPSAYFSFRGNSQMHLPIVDWGAFRGYAVAVWINVDFQLPQVKRGSSVVEGVVQDSVHGKFNVFRFANGSNTLGVEASLERAAEGASHGGRGVLLNVRCCAPNTSSEAKKSASVAASFAHCSEWRTIQQKIDLVPGEWHLLVISHSLHYVKKSSVTCYVDNKFQFREELVYPSGLVTASKCTVGGGRNAKAKIASVSMYHDELSRGTIELMYALGPTMSSFNRWSAALPSQSSRLIAGSRECALGLSPLAVPENESFTAFCKLQVVFAFNAQNTVNEDYADLGVEWVCEGTTPTSNGKWLTFENSIDASAEIQQRNARLGKSTHKVTFPDYQSAWHQSVGVSSLPVLLDYILTAYERVARKESPRKRAESTEYTAAGEGGRFLPAVMESVVIDLLWICKGMLLSNVANQEEVLRNYVFHMLSHVLVRHNECLSVVWTPGSLVLCVEFVKSLYMMMPRPRQSLETDDNHPFHASIWTTNPLFASGVRAILMDYRLWTQADFKAQSIYNRQMYVLACEYPRAFNNMQAVAKVLEILGNHYSVTHSSHTSSEGETSQNTQQLTEPDDKEHRWKQQSILSLVELIEVCLTNQSTHVYEVLEQEVMETTFARASASTGVGGSSIAGGAGPSLSTSTPSLSSASPSIAVPARRGGVFSINLESIVWSDQTAACPGSPRTPDARVSDGRESFTEKSVLRSVQVRFSLVRDIRAVTKFLMTSHDATVCTSILLLLRRLAVSFLDMRFALVSSSIMDCLLYLMRDRRADFGSSGISKRNDEESSHAFVHVRLACVPLFIYLLDWLESIEGRTVWCGLEEHLRLVLNGQGSFSVGFLELMMEFYFDPAWLLGVQHSIIMNDPSKKDSLLFPIAPAVASNVTLAQKNGVEDGIAAAVSSTLTATGEVSTGLDGLIDWIKMANHSVGKRLQLTWEKRAAVIRLIALRSLYNVGVKDQDLGDGKRSSALVANVFDEGIRGILSLPLKSILPFLPFLLGKSTSYFREKVLMDVNVKLKTDNDLQQQLLSMKKSWADALLELSLTCSVSAELSQSSYGDTDDGNDRQDENCGRAYSFDASKTGEDLVLDTIVSLLSMAMSNHLGWQSFTHLLLALKGIQTKYETKCEATSSHTLSSLPPLAHVAPHVNRSELFCSPLNWVCRVAGIVLQRMARSRTILSRTLAENVQRLLFLADETLLIAPLKPLAEYATSSSDAPSNKYTWSDAQLFLLNAVLDICARLIDSTHNNHRIGLLPGLQILQHALPYIHGKCMMERVVEVLIQSFQQEMATGSALSVYAMLPTRDVFLRALVDLRRALVVHEREELLELLRRLTLRICTSGSFNEELDAAGLSLYELGKLTEAQAVEVVLDTLALAINDTELHEREEQDDMVPYFPVAKELQSSSQNAANVSDNSTEVASQPYEIYADVDKADDTERVLWAALEVEENRMLAILRDVTNRENQRAVTALSVQRKQEQGWTQKLWLKHELTFRSQNQHNALRRVAPDTLAAMQKTLMWQVGRYETPFPSRVRRTVDVNLQLSSKKMLALIAKESVDGGVEAKRSSEVGYLSGLVVPFEMVHGAEKREVRNRDAVSSENLLTRVGRVVAQQRGGEIRDITSDDSLSLSGLADTYVSSTGIGEKVVDEAEARSLVDEEHFDEYKDCAMAVSPEGDESKASSCMSSPAASEGTVLGQGDKGLDPGAGVAVVPGDQVYACVTCIRVVPEGVILGRLSFCGKYIAFEPRQEIPENAWNPGGGTNAGTIDFDDSTLPALSSTNVDEAAPGLHRCWRWKYTHLVGVYLRRYRLRDSAIEIFLRNGSTHFLDWPLTTKQRRNEVVRVLYSFLPRSTPKQWPGRIIPHLATTTKAWQNRQISNFDYLMALNTFAGRSFNDLTQYPVFPWVLSNYGDSTLDLSDPANFRDLSKPVGALNANRLEEYWERYYSFDDPVIPRFLYGSHYSTCAGVVLFFLFRLEPFASLHRKMQNGTFDLPDRLFFSIQETWRMCNSQMSEVKELTPEFFSGDGTFLCNRNGYALGKRHDQKAVENVQLPKWASTPEEFVRIHRAALESEYVSSHLHSWIDLIFGYKQRGRASLQANNVFYYLTYYGVVDLDKVEDPCLRESMELQIAHFGQCPMQLFATPHLARDTAFARNTVGKAVASGMNSLSNSETTSPPRSGGLPGKEGVSNGPSSNLFRPLSQAFQDFSPIAQEKRRNWSPVATVKPIVQSGMKLLKILPGRIVGVNELGVIEIYYWRLLPKPTPPWPTSPHGESAFASSNLQGVPPITLAVEPGKAVNTDRDSFLFATDSQRDSERATLSSDFNGVPDGGEESEADLATDCPWLLEFVRDDSPFEYVPRIPVFDHVPLDNESDNLRRRPRRFPVSISRNGRVLVSGGARSGALHFRLLDLDNGHVIGKASVVGHSAAVTCLSLDRWSYHDHSQTAVSTSQRDEELLVSGSKDGTLALWRLSRLKPDILFRLPRVSPRPIQIFRGHATPVVDCCVSTYIGVVVSCSHAVGIVHFLYDEGQVAFNFEPAEEGGEIVRVCLSVKGYVIAVTSIVQRATDTSETNSSDSQQRVMVSTTCQIFNLSGVMIKSHHFPSEEVVDVQVSAEGDVIFFTLYPGIVRIYRIDDFAMVQEYVSSSPAGSMITATCFGPEEAVILLASGHEDGTLSLQMLPDASGSVSFLTNVRRLLGVSSKLKRVKGTVQHAQTLAMSTLDNAKAVTSTARDIAGEALGEAKVMMRGLISYLQKS